MVVEQERADDWTFVMTQGPRRVRSRSGPRRFTRYSFWCQIVLRGDDLPTRFSFHPRVGETVAMDERDTLAAAFDDEPTRDRGRDGAELVNLHPFVVRRRHRVTAAGDVVEHLVTAHQLVVFRIDELGRQQLVEQRAVTLHETGRPLVLESHELDRAGFRLL